jgi:hypothetical protein
MCVCNTDRLFGFDLGDSESSLDEQASVLPNKKKSVDEQKLIRSRFYGSESSDFSTISPTNLSCHDADSQLGSSGSGASLDDGSNDNARDTNKKNDIPIARLDPQISDGQ